MTVNLPEYEQVVFAEPPLDEVVCQLRYNQILKISASPPSEYQELVRNRFPVFGQQHGFQVKVSGSEPVLATATEPAWQFKSADESWLLSLTSSFLALRTTSYQHFEDFLDRLLPAVFQFQATYQVPFYTRLGLRYVNRFIQERPEVGQVNWAEYLNGSIAGLHMDGSLGMGIAEASHHLVLNSALGQIGFRYSMDSGIVDGRAAERFTLDFDHFATGQLLGEQIKPLLLGFNDALYRLFRWCLTERGYELLKPSPKNVGGVHALER